MWNKIFLVLLVVAVLGMLGLTYFSYSSLQSITKPADVIANYNFYNNLYWSFLWISSLALLIVGNVILWMQRKSWALWSSLLFFASFIILQTWWLGEMYFDYKTQNKLGEGGFSLSGIYGALICIAAAVAVFFDQFLIMRMRDRIHGKPNLAIENQTAHEIPAIEADTEKEKISHDSEIQS